jgi:hypothetical protein
MELSLLFVISILIFFVAALYSSVGHGGASGYLAILSFFTVAPAIMSSTALILNVLVAGIGVVVFTRAKHLSLRLSWPFILLSIPAAFLGGLFHVADKTYFLLLAFALFAAAIRLAFTFTSGENESSPSTPSILAALPIGGAIGFLSGIVGVGGGIFLSPIMILRRWADPKRTSAVSALFIVVNSIAGIIGRITRSGFEFSAAVPFLVAAFLGGLVGSHFGANKFSSMTLRRILSAVLLIAAFKLVVTWGALRAS